MDPRLRDGVLAGGTLAALLAGLRCRGAVEALRDPLVVVSGVTTALLVEWAFLRYPDRLLAWWERPAVNRGSALGVVGAAVLVRRRPRLLAAGAWGLATYLALLWRLLRRGPRDVRAGERRQRHL